MKKIIYIIKKIVISICALYTINIIIYKTGNIIPINYYSIPFVAVFGLPGVVGLFILKKLVG